jgi:hypothetical protein
MLEPGTDSRLQPTPLPNTNLPLTCDFMSRSGVAYVIERASRSGTRYVGVYRAANGKYKSAGTYDSHERAYEVADEEERHARGFLEETTPAGKATMTISEFGEQRFLRYHAVSPGTRQEYGYVAKNHIVPYIGHLRISEVNRETFFNLLVNVLPAEGGSTPGACHNCLADALLLPRGPGASAGCSSASRCRKAGSVFVWRLAVVGHWPASLSACPASSPRSPDCRFPRRRGDRTGSCPARCTASHMTGPRSPAGRRRSPPPQPGHRGDPPRTTPRTALSPAAGRTPASCADHGGARPAPGPHHQGRRSSPAPPATVPPRTGRTRPPHHPSGTPPAPPQTTTDPPVTNPQQPNRYKIHGARSRSFRTVAGVISRPGGSLTPMAEWLLPAGRNTAAPARTPVRVPVGLAVSSSAKTTISITAR